METDKKNLKRIFTWSLIAAVIIVISFCLLLATMLVSISSTNTAIWISLLVIGIIVFVGAYIFTFLISIKIMTTWWEHPKVNNNRTTW
ncbi:MAG: hypothetical protein ACRC4L_03580, partial [Mycoplasma sp.]